jgi:2-phospho-L-lactate guanylyltransferase
MNATAIIPVKRFATAKRRLLDAIDPPARAALIKAMLADVLAATAACDAVERIIVVTGEGRAEKVALATSQRVRAPLEVMRDPDDVGHPEAATLGIVRAKALGAECAVLLPGDCPLLDTAELGAAMGRTSPGRVTVVPDRHGTGTNALILSPPDAIAPGFGPGSRERHVERAERRGLEVAVEELDSLALDLDTPDDLHALAEVLAATPDRAPATAAELSRLGIP